jgi:hypothetical protein
MEKIRHHSQIAAHLSGRATPQQSIAWLLMFPEDRSHNDHDHGDQEHKDGDAVDPMHIFYQSSPRSIGIFLLDKKIFAYLSPYAHNAKVGMFFTPKSSIFNTRSTPDLIYKQHSEIHLSG